MTLVNTLVQPLRSKYGPGTMDKNELRFSRYGVLDFFQQQTQMEGGILTAETKANIKKSFGKTIQIPVLDADDVTIGNTRSCTVVADENTSQLVQLTFVTYSFGFTMVPSQHFNNDISYQADFTRKLNKYLLKFAATLDTACRNKLETDKNQYFPAEILAYYAQVGNALQVTQAEKDDYFNQLEAIINQMDYYDNIHIIGSTSLMPMVKRLKAQGSANDTNQSFQMNPWNWGFSNRVTNGVGIKSTMYAVPDGYVAMDNRNDPDAIAGNRIGDFKEWGEIDMPVVNLKMGSYYYKDCADMSALHAGTTGLSRTMVEGFEFSTDVCYVTAYNSDAANRYSPILKAEVSTT